MQKETNNKTQSSFIIMLIFKFIQVSYIISSFSLKAENLISLHISLFNRHYINCKKINDSRGQGTVYFYIKIIVSYFTLYFFHFLVLNYR